MGIAVTLIFGALSLLLQYLLSKGYLTPHEIRRLNALFYRFHRVEAEAVKRGCVPGGTEQDWLAEQGNHASVLPEYDNPALGPYDGTR